ncbi:hypothetical protein BG006_011011 [Podila minutissima]|uniref:T6SS Phospholipase effector Tle1-like catalytic domain-containing protein n=1 Tax=Podila minutissima TaxID=64525 RepID=A0A9P5VI71_9FUNG|nr:hypothetical protein BG006_011011 [Podila minutissima]
MAPTERVVVLCDGTWAGSETKTETNIFLLAEMMGLDKQLYLTSTSGQNIPHKDTARGIKACYFPGAGLGGTFLEYLFNGATGHDIDDNCLEVYEYIVQHYTPQNQQSPQPEVWMFGFSRGAYTVRCVAGMIYNCGILKRRKNGHTVSANDNAALTDEEKALCRQVYWIYRSNDPADHPESPRSTTFRARASHNVGTPIKFMGLLDTVGALGIPYLNPGVGLTFNEFRDTKISTVVEKVYHAVCIHERMWSFEPCHVLPAKNRIGPQFEIHERWFPGCHYDVGRHLFQFFPSGGPGATIGSVINGLSQPVKPNLVFADLALKWMLESIKEHSRDELISNVDAKIKELVTNMESADDKYTGNGDIYSNLLQYGPLGSVWGTLVDTLKQFEGSTSNVGSDVIVAVSALQPIAEPLWKFARFNFHLA